MATTQANEEKSRRFQGFHMARIAIDGGAISFFFTNFPERWTKSEMQNTFKKYGTVVNVYIAKKKNNRGKNFGFVRFIHIKEVTEFKRRIESIYIDSIKR